MENLNVKQDYLKPAIEVIEVETEGIMASSVPDVTGGGSIYQSTGRKSGNVHQSQSALNELEDIINDILTY